VIHSLIQDKEKREEIINYVKERGIDQLIMFDDVLEYLITETKESQYYYKYFYLRMIKIEYGLTLLKKNLQFNIILKSLKS